jgi:hypothetical protein
LIGIRLSNFREGKISKFFPKHNSQDQFEPFACPICNENIFSKDEQVLSDHVLACSSTDHPLKVSFLAFHSRIPLEKR